MNKKVKISSTTPAQAECALPFMLAKTQKRPLLYCVDFQMMNVLPSKIPILYLE